MYDDEVEIALNKLLTAVKPQPLNKSNWAFWAKSFNYAGVFGSMHSMLLRLAPAAMRAAFLPVRSPMQSNRAMDNDFEVVADGVPPRFETMTDMDEITRRRLESAERQRKATAFLSEGLHAIESCNILVQCLQPQIRLIKSLMLQSGARWETQENELREGRRQHPVKTVAELGHTMLQECFQLLQSDAKFAHISRTHSNSAHILLCVLRSSAVVYELIVRSMSMYPQKLLNLIDQPGPDVANQVVDDFNKGCMLDGFSRSFLAPRLEQLQSESSFVSPEVRCYSSGHEQNAYIAQT